MIQILAIGDIHGAVGVYRWLLESAMKLKPDAVILAGDLFSAGWEAEQRAEARNSLIPLLKRISAPVLYIMGNDDNVALEYEDEQIRSLHGRRLTVRGFHFVGYQFTPPFMGTEFVKRESEIEADLHALSPLLDQNTVLVTHTPAFGKLDTVSDGAHVGSPSVAALLARRPVLAHLHGHVHGCFGCEGNHFNVAAAAQRRAFLIELPNLNSRVLEAQ